MDFTPTARRKSPVGTQQHANDTPCSPLLAPGSPSLHPAEHLALDFRVVRQYSIRATGSQPTQKAPCLHCTGPLRIDALYQAHSAAARVGHTRLRALLPPFT